MGRAFQGTEQDLIVLDEPVSGVDTTTQHAVFEVLETLRNDGKTVVVATHDLNCIVERFDQVLCLNRRLVAYGPPGEVFREDVLNKDIDAIPAAERGSWCLQEKIDYAPCLTAVDGGGVKVEIRMMFYRPAGESRLVLGLNLCRLSRGKMLGVDFNKDFTWVGSSVALQPPGT